MGVFMTYSVVRQSLVGLGVAATTLAIYAAPLHAGECATVLSASCSKTTVLRDMSFGISSAPKTAPKRAAHRRNFTVSTQGFAPKATRVDTQAAGLGSGLVYDQGEDGEPGNLALAVDGGRLSVDMRKNFMKVVYTLDF